MRTLIVAVGNRLRRDDGVAHHVLDLLGDLPGVRARAVFQLTPELSQEIADFDVILFIDADASATALSLEPLDSSTVEAAALTHVSRPAEIVVLSRMLFGFSGRAWLCRVPVDDLSAGEGLSHRAAIYCGDALSLIEQFSTQMLKTGRGTKTTSESLVKL